MNIDELTIEIKEITITNQQHSKDNHINLNRHNKASLKINERAIEFNEASMNYNEIALNINEITMTINDI